MYHVEKWNRNFWNIRVVATVRIGNFGYWEMAYMFCKSRRPGDKSFQSAVMRDIGF